MDKITGTKIERDGFVLDAAKIAEAHAKLFKMYGPTLAHEMCLHLTAYLAQAVAGCDAAQLAGSKVSRTDRGKAATDYMKALAEGADQLFAQVKAKEN